VARTIDKIAELKKALGLTVLMAEQNLPQAIRIADRGYVLVHGEIVFTAHSADALRQSDLVRRLYLGIEAPAAAAAG
jgi:branched-chain amino acid transport system ATP-binding protein